MTQGIGLLNSGIRDNLSRGSVADFLRDKIDTGSNLSVVSAYFTIYAYAGLMDELDKVEKVRFLFGEPRFVRAVDPRKSEARAFSIVDSELKIENQLRQRWIARKCAAWIRERVEIRSIRQSNLLHGKMYHIEHSGSYDAIVGSSNFTTSGLGLGQPGNNNIELNLEVLDRRDLEDLQRWFEELWDDEERVEDVRDEVLRHLKKLYQDNTPQFIYYKTLFHLFESYLREQEEEIRLRQQIQLTDTTIWHALFEFQKDGVKGAINKILDHNGCVIADSVGLGKTYEALAIIKYFELLNNRVLVLCPKKLRENWTVFQAHNNSPLNPFLSDRFSYTVLSHTDLSRDGGYSGDINLATLNWGNFDLIVIDESHNFRNNTKGRRDEEGNRISRSRYERLMEDIIQSGVKTKVLLLSATPVNNNLSDLRNQLYFLTEGRDDAFRDSIGINSLTNTLANAQRAFTQWAEEGSRNTAHLLESLSAGFFKLLDELTIARSRKHIERYYPETLDDLGGFPERLKPLSHAPDIDLAGRFPSYSRLNDEISRYRLALYSPSFYVKPGYEQLYDPDAIPNFTQEQRERYLIGMMKVNFLKRLESSVHSFAETMRRTVEKIEELEARIQTFQRLEAENPEADLTLDAEELAIEDVDDEELQAALEVGRRLTFKLAHLELDRWLEDLQADKRQMHWLWLAAKDVGVDRDAKLEELKSLIREKVENPATNKFGEPNRKVLVFTAFADTAHYLYKNLHKWARDELGIQTAVVVGGTGGNATTLGATEFNQILTNFAPRAKRRRYIPSMPQEQEIDLLIGTDCISEGQNLQDCDTAVNYDIHWNPVRIIQRFGRIDRINSPNNSVQLINFWPTTDLNEYINLRSRVEARMALVDVTATQQDNLLRPEDVDDLITEELRYRDQQLLRLKDEVLDLEELDDNIALNNFTLDDFRIDLSNYIESNRRVLEEAPLGLYALVPTDLAYPTLRPGVIFCLRQKGEAGETQTINPLRPYFLVYVRDDGEVRYRFTQPKQILDIYRHLCAGDNRVHEALCNQFDSTTDHGREMTVYDELLQKSVAAIARTFKRRAVEHLTSGRDALLPPQTQQVGDETEFELITWLIIK